jgi:hypothetical protein
MYDKSRIRAAKLQMRRVLLEEWDPIGIADEPRAQNEYDGYLGDIYDLLSSDVSEAEIALCLNQFETVTMGITERSFDKLLSVAQSLKRIRL